MAQQSSSRRGLVYRVLVLIAVGLITASFFAPGWWVSLKAPNYPEATFPDGIRIHFHMDSVRNGCKIRTSQEVVEDEALDCVHEMDTINHYVGMYPIASGGPVEKGFSPFLFSFLIVMALAFAAPGRKSRMAVSVLGYGAIAAWMGMTMYMPGGIKYQSPGYVEGLVNSLGLDVKETGDDSNLAPIVRQLKESMNKTQTAETESGGPQSKAALIANLQRNFNIDQFKAPEDKRQEWTGSGMQVLAWHYDKSLSRWFNMPERNGRLTAIMENVAALLSATIIGAMALMTFAAWSERSIFYWLLVLIPAALPIGFLFEYSAWLWWYGHSLNEMGAFTLKPFMPTVFGQGKVAQFTTYSYPHYGFGLMVAASLLLLLAALVRRKELRLSAEKSGA